MEATAALRRFVVGGSSTIGVSHYRIVAENEASEGNEPGEVTPSFGEDKTFKTPCKPPTITLVEEAVGEDFHPYPNRFIEIYVNPNRQETTVEVESEPFMRENGLHIRETLYGDTPQYITTVLERHCNPRNLPEPPVQDPVVVHATNAAGTSTSSVPHEFFDCGAG